MESNFISTSSSINNNISNPSSSYLIDSYNTLLLTKLINYQSTPNHGLITDNSIAYDDCDIFQEFIITYRLHKIRCLIEPNTGIAGIQLTYKDRETNKEIVSIDVHKSGDLISQEFTLEPLEIIIEARLWTKESLTGFEITTNKKRSKRFGYDNGEMIIPEGIEDGKNLVLGFFLNFENRLGVTSIGFHYLSRTQFSLVLYSGLLYLRIKLKDPEFRKEIKSKLDNMEYSEKVLFNTCILPDSTFFGIVKYTMG